MRRYKLILSVILLAWVAQASAENIVVIVHPTVDASEVTKEVIKQVYLGQSRAFVPYDQPSKSGLREKFFPAATGRAVLQVKSIWSKLVFGGRANHPPEKLRNSKAIIRAVADNENAMGYVLESELNDTVQKVLVLPLD